MHIRTENPQIPEEAARITDIHYAAFKGHPMHPLGAEPMEQVIVERLRAAGALSLSLVAEEKGAAVGHIAFSPAVVGKAASGWHLLGPVGVVPEHQRQGIGSALINEALERMRSAGVLGVVLVGDPGFYTRFGFRSFQGLMHKGVPQENVLAMAFTAHEPQGEIIAHAAFTPPFD